MRPSPQTLPVRLLILDVHRFARAQGEVSRTADRIANLFRCRVRPDINRRRGWREGSVPSRSTCDLDAHWRVDVQREPADEHIDEAQLCLDLRRPVRALGNGFNRAWRDRKSTRLNSSHLVISYAVFCLKKKKKL